MHAQKVYSVKAVHCRICTEIIKNYKNHFYTKKRDLYCPTLIFLSIKQQINL